MVHDLIFKKFPNNFRQRQYTKCHSLKVKRLPQVSVSNNNRKLKPVVTESVANQEQLLNDVENELKKKKPSQPTLSILNRQLFNNETFSVIPKRIGFAPTLMLEEAIRFYADFKDATVKIQAMLFWISPESGNHTDNLLKLQQKLISKKTCDKLFMKVDCESIGEYIRVPSSYGPQVIFNHKEYGIRSRHGLEMDTQPLVSTSEMVVILVIVYYLLDLSYPSCFGQLLGFFQEICGF
ncbi:uncharacterized protein LOC136091699 [Hydra vulgaris]|uniref:Uncharacterized protein LOC136091699 n=1 Tax=Hydra vulgaris TaxID=6087 RepID=A0ABM4DLQ7_HYDVU